MRKLLLILLLLFPAFNSINAETWNCEYFHNGKFQNLTTYRNGNHFERKTDDDLIIHDYIHYEDSKVIILVHHYYADIDESSVFVKVLDKVERGFSFVGLGYPDSTDIIKGNCKIY